MFSGKTFGEIVAPRGSGNFGSGKGWDPVFQPCKEDNPKGETYAEMETDFKIGISHRSRSLAKLQAFLQTL